MSYVIWNIVCLKKFLYFFIMDQTMKSFYHKRVSRRIQTIVYLFRRKYWKIHNLRSSNKKKVTLIDKNREEITKNISYILQFIENTRFMASLLSNLVNNLSDGIHRIQCKLGHDDKKCETYAIKYKYCGCFLEYANFKDDLIEYKCLCCNKSYQQKLTKS